MTVIPSCRSVDIRKPQYTGLPQRIMAKFLCCKWQFLSFIHQHDETGSETKNWMVVRCPWYKGCRNDYRPRLWFRRSRLLDIDDFYFIFILSYYGCMFCIIVYINKSLYVMKSFVFLKNGFTSQYSLINVISVCIVSTLFKTMSPFHIGCAPLYVSLSIYVCILFSLSFYFAGTCIIYISTVIQIQIT